MFLLDTSVSGFCADTASIWGLLGYVIMVFKIVIPLLLIILGMIDLGKAVVASDDKAISKSVNTLIQRFVAAIIMFFIPTIVSAIFNATTNSGVTKDSNNICVQCLTNVSAASKCTGKPGSDTCKFNGCKSTVDITNGSNTSGTDSGSGSNNSNSNTTN